MGEYLRSVWLPAAGVTLRPSTLASYEDTVAAYLVPSLGEVPLEEVAPPEINALYGRLLAGSGDRRALASGTVRRVHAVLHRALRDAVRWRLLDENPADGADPPRMQRPDLRPWSAAELARFLRSAETDPWYSLWVFYALTGTRRGEALGLRWRDVDLAGRTVAIRSTLVSAGHRRVFGEPKTARGRRVIAVEERVVAALVHRRAELGGEPADDALVFCEADGTPLNPETVTRRFNALVRRTGARRARLHDLRHAHATLALAAGIDTRVLSGRLGHATTAFTADVYQHLLPGMDRDAAARIARLVDDEEDKLAKREG